MYAVAIRRRSVEAVGYAVDVWTAGQVAGVERLRMAQEARLLHPPHLPDPPRLWAARLGRRRAITANRGGDRSQVDQAAGALDDPVEELDRLMVGVAGLPGHAGEQYLELHADAAEQKRIGDRLVTWSRMARAKITIGKFADARPEV